MSTDSSVNFLPMNIDEMHSLGWDQCDFILITGDAYVDHPSFGAALIGRLLEAEGFRVGIIAQPDWNYSASLQILGRPRLAFLITSGNMDSMVNHYTAAGKLRHNDAYTPGGAFGQRPDRALIVYSSLAKAAYKGVPVILGGIEASLRRLSHYDYWSDKLRRSVLLDSKADILVYGMAERAIRSIAHRIAAGEELRSIRDVRGTVYRLTGKEAADAEETTSFVTLPAFEQMRSDKTAFARSFAVRMQNADPFSASALGEEASGQLLIQNPPDYPLSEAELDAVYELPYVRQAHPSYQEPIPALEEVRFSLVSSRGCFGGCSFCALTFHQGRIVKGRSHESLLREARQLIYDENFKGYIHDVGGPTANFRRPACAQQKLRGACVDRQCLFPEPCPQLQPDHADYRRLLQKLRELPEVKKVFVRSGIRYDYLLADKKEGQAFLRDLCEHHISGQLKIAPEHVSDAVLQRMGKPGSSVYRRFMDAFAETNRQVEKKQYLIPYFIAAHPGSTLKDAVELAEFCRDQHFVPQQVQEFYPTPGTVATCMYYTGVDPRSMEAVYVPRGGREKRMQRALLQYNRPENAAIVREALRDAGRSDLIGNGPKTLVPAERSRGGTSGEQNKKATAKTPKGTSKKSRKGTRKGPAIR
ncbi:MAG: YgiQ family radical SAM protein [Spirochaetaceae bacterium]|nr:YgiQ family radical SAM protein [Spirochaetaceae bacterium]MCF7947251.1 YgiQ family radical SAM protein [Spirochaetia bacterium]MCF7950290.1 YgiQ family radical SAM protein [Spirochaetaceae bacterium]